MKISASTKFRMVYGASAIALSTGLASAASAQMMGGPITETVVVDDGDTFVLGADEVIETVDAGEPGIVGGDEVDITNDGTITTTGDDAADAIAVGFDSFVTNNGLLQTSGDDSFGIFGEDGVTVTNSATGEIITTGVGGLGISLGDMANITNAGSITIGGDLSIAIDAVDNAMIMNTGTITVTGDQSVGITVGLDSTIVNDGTIATEGFEAFAIIANEGSTVTLGANSMITTEGEDAAGVVILGAGTFTNDGMISVTGDGADAVVIAGDATVTNGGTIFSADGRALDIGGLAMITNSEMGVISSDGDDGIRLDTDGATITNAGLIRSDGDEAIEASGLNDITVNNTGTIIADENGDKGIEANENLTVINSGRIESVTSEAVEADGAGLFLDNSGEIISPKDDAVDGNADVTIINTGLIQGGENDGLELDSGTITNSGIIESLSSDPEGDFSDAGLMNRELDAGIDFDGVDDPDNLAGPETDTVTNLEGGIIRGDIGINASSGNFVSDGEGGSVADSPANVRSQTIVNFGTISGNIVNPDTGRIDAVLLSFGDDVFQQWQTGVTNGTVDGEEGDDTLIFGNNGTEAFVIDLSEISDEANFTNFETTQLLDVGAGITLVGEGEIALDVLEGDITVEGTLLDTLTFTGEGTLTVTETGAIDVVDGDAVFVEEGIDGFVLTNSGLLQTAGDDFFGVFANNDTTVTNTATGEIITGGAGGFGISLLDMATIVNDGTIMTMGDQAFAVDAGDDAMITNTGAILTERDESVGINVGENAVISSDGIVGTQGVDSIGIIAGDGSAITVGATGIITTSGTDAAGLVVLGNGTLDNSGQITTIGDGATAVAFAGDATITNSGSITAEMARAIEIGGMVTITNTETGVIDSEGNDGIEINTDGAMITNAGLIRSNDDEAIEAGDVNGLTVINSGTIIADEGGDKAIESEMNLTVINSGRIESVNDEAVEAEDAGLMLENTGEIIAPKDDAVDGDADVTIINSGLIQGGENDGLELDSGTITNSGIIESLSSDPDGDFSDAALTNRELDAGIDFDGVDDPANLAGPAFDTVTNLEGGIIRGDIGINASSGNFVSDGEGGSVAGSPANVREQVIINYGTISGNLLNPATGRTDAVLLSGGNDTFRQMQTGVTNGTVDGEGGDDTLIFGNDGMTSVTRDLANVFDPLKYTGFETIGFLDENGGGIILAGDTDETINVLGGSVTIEGAVTETVEVLGVSTLTIAEGASVDVADDDGIDVDVDGVTIINNGTIGSADDEAIEAGSVNDLTVINNGLIIARDGGDKGIESEQNLTVINTGRIESVLDEAVEAEDAGLFLDNSGEIIAPKDDAVDGDADVTIINSGLIQGGENDGLELDSGTITNSGIIESLSSDPDGDFSDAALTNRELDAGIDFDGVDDPDNLAGPATDLVTNMAGGIIRGDIGINASSGNFVSDGEGGSEQGSPANVRSQTVVNFGEITSNLVNPVTGRMDAVLLGAGADEFQQWTGATVNGWVDLEGGDDTFILEGTASSISGGVQGGEGTDTAIIAGVLDADNIFGFELIQLGSTLGGTLNDAVISGNRMIDGDVSVVGEVTLALGVDTLGATGSITLEDGSTVTITTPLDNALVGQTVLVLQDGGPFVDNGATINIVDDDLLLDYTPVIGSLLVNVSAVDPLAGTGDANLENLGRNLTGALNNATLSATSFGILNGLSQADAIDALADSLPNLAEGDAREIFETSSVASEVLRQHLAGEGSGLWGQFVARSADQDPTGQSFGGYSSDQLIFTLGGDFVASDMVRIGLLGSYAQIENDNTSGTVGNNLRGTTDIDSIKLGAYGALTVAERVFINGEIAYLTGEVESARGGAFGAITSEYDFDGFAYSLTVGLDLLPDDGVALVPSLAVNGASISFDDSTEAGGFGFGVVREDADFVELRGAVELGADLSPGVSGFIRGTIIRDFGETARGFLLSSSELGTLAVRTADREDDRFELAAGATIDIGESFAIDLGYLGDFAEGYSAHAARITGRIAF